MPLRPIDAVFVHFEQRQYVVYYRGELWQLPRMKIDNTSWQRRQPYEGAANALYLGRDQIISDPILAQQLRTLNLPAALRGCTLPRFEAWWEAHGFEWLKDKLITGQSPLAAHIGIMPTKTTNAQAISTTNVKTAVESTTINPSSISKVTAPTEVTDIFATMLADLADEVLHHPL